MPENNNTRKNEIKIIRKIRSRKKTVKKLLDKLLSVSVTLFSLTTEKQ